MISNFSILILVHFFSDFFLQPESWALNKTKQFKPLFYHSIQYTIPFAIAFYFLQISYYWLILIFVMHILIDNRKFLFWFNLKIKKIKNPPLWLIIVQDQIIHILTLVPIVI